jgi:hypothetical protein
MAQTKTPITPDRWYAHDEKAFKRLTALGAPAGKIYKGWTKVEHWSRIIMRKGEWLGIVGGLRAFGGLRDIPKAVKRFHDQGATILDVETKMDSRADGVTMRHDATKPQRQSQEYDRLLAEERADARRKKDGKMLKREAYVVWRNPKLSIAEKADLTGWPPSTLNAVFGPSGAPAGRRPKVAA